MPNFSAGQNPFGSNQLPSMQGYKFRGGVGSGIGGDQSQDQGGGLLDLLKQLGFTGGMNPWLMGGSMLAQGLGGLIDTQQKKDQRWQSGQVRDMYDQLRWNNQPFQGANIDRQMGNFQQSLNLPQMMANASRYSGISSPESQKLYGGNLMRLLSGRRGQLEDQNTQYQFQDKWNRQNMMSQLLGMMG